MAPTPRSSPSSPCRRVEPRGVVVLVHGGFWRPEYGIEYARPLVPSLVEAGWAVWAIEYRRGTGAQDTLDDVAAAIRALPIEADVVAAVGHSAGGHLATWAAGQDLGLTHVISQAGVLDLGAAHDAGLGGGAVEAFLGHPPGPEDAAVDPIRQVPLDVPVWCVHGSADTIVPPRSPRRTSTPPSPQAAPPSSWSSRATTSSSSRPTPRPGPPSWPSSTGSRCRDVLSGAASRRSGRTAARRPTPTAAPGPARPAGRPAPELAMADGCPTRRTRPVRRGTPGPQAAGRGRPLR